MTEPIACTLSRDQYERRTGDIADLARRSLLRRDPLPGGTRLTFDARVEPELRELVAAEAECCAFLHMQLERTPAGLELEVTGPAEAKPIIDELFA